MAEAMTFSIRPRGNAEIATEQAEDQLVTSASGTVEAKKKRKKKKEGKSVAPQGNYGRFTQEYGTDFGSLSSWVKVCRDLGVENELHSKRQCKKALEQTFVNIIDFLHAVDCRNADARRIADPTERAATFEKPVLVRTFQSERELVKYTMSTKRFYPLSEIKTKKAHPLRLLMRYIRYPSAGM